MPYFQRMVAPAGGLTAPRKKVIFMITFFIVSILHFFIHQPPERMNIPMDEELIACTHHLIESGTNFDLIALDSIYAPELRIVMLNERDEITVIDKAANTAFFKQKKAAGAKPLSKQTLIHYAEQKGDHGYVFLTRKMKLSDRWEELKYHLEWRKYDDRWRVIHENVYAQPLTHRE